MEVEEVDEAWDDAWEGVGDGAVGFLAAELADDLKAEEEEEEELCLLTKESRVERLPRESPPELFVGEGRREEVCGLGLGLGGELFLLREGGLLRSTSMSSESSESERKMGELSPSDSESSSELSL